MTDAIFLRTRHEWLAALGAKSAIVKQLCVDKAVSDSIYKAAGEKYCANADAFNFCNSVEHNDAVISTIEQLEANGESPDTLKKFITDLTSQNTYGTFAELSAYRFLLKGGHQFDIQAPMNGASILNPNGSDLDGRLKLPEEIYFDAKGFGFLDHLVKRLTERLSQDCAPNFVVAQSSWDVSAELLSDLLGKSYTALLRDLQLRRRAIRGAIEFTMRKPTRIQITERTIDPDLAAQENSEYVFRFSKQFTRHHPFFLIFVIHPWFSGSLHVNFDGSLDAFTTEFAKRTFCQFESDSRPMFDVTRSQAIRLLSGIVFVDAWEGARVSAGPSYRLFLNPNATNKPTVAAVNAFAAPYGSDMLVDYLKCCGDKKHQASP